MDKSTFKRFTAKVLMPETPDDCMEWTGVKDSRGYGQLRTSSPRKMRLAHRLSYEHFVGPIPDGLVVRHRCDNPACVRPDHLETGTQRENAMDAVLRGRHARTALKNEQVIEIRARYAAGDTTCKKLGAEFGVNKTTVRDLVKRKTWVHI